MKQVFYADMLLMSNSTAFELWQEWQKAAGKEKETAKKKLDQHVREVNLRYETMHGRLPTHLTNFKVGNKLLDLTQAESYNKDSQEHS